MGLTSIFVTHDQEEALELADRVVVMDHGRIDQVGTPEQVYMEPATPFVSNFVGETNLFPAKDGQYILHVRPHDIEIVSEGGNPVLVDNVFRKGGFWRVDGTLSGSDKVVELDLDASRAAPAPGATVLVRPRRSKTFSKTGELP